MVKKCDILEFSYSSRGRDVDIVEPVLSYLELKHGLKIIRSWCFGNFIFDIFKYNPKMIIIANAVGSYEHFHVAKFASKLGIKVVTLISEGDYIETEEGTKEFFWGWNKDKQLYEDLHLEWTERNYNLINKYIPESKRFNIKVGGATGFDRYKFWRFMSKQHFLKKYNKTNFKKVIGFAGYGFDLICGEYYEKFKEVMDQRYGENKIDFHLESKDQLKEIYRRLITCNPDILFVVKYHPLTINEELTELYQLDKYDNVIKVVTEENIADIINVCDLWMAYDSTSCLEAWLMGKKSILINPLGGAFKRSHIASGSPIKTSYDEVQRTLLEFYQNGEIEEFNDLSEKRKEIIKKVIQWDDGKNHVRTGKYIYELFQETRKKRKCIDLELFEIIIKFEYQALKELIKKIIFKTKLKNSAPLRKAFKAFRERQKLFYSEERENNHQKYLKYLKEFYEKSHI